MALTTNLVSYYKFDANNSNDSVGTNNGTDTAITYSAGNGKINNGAGFNGTSSVISLGDPASLHNANLSIGVWFKATGFGSGMCFISKNYVAAPWSSPYATLYFRVNSSTTIEVGLSNGTTPTPHVFTVSTLSTATWYHIVFTYDGTTGTLYLNGTSQGTSTYSVVLGYNGQPWLIGADNSASPQGDYWNGALDEIGIWSRALTSAEVTQLYNGGAGFQYPFASANPLVFSVNQAINRASTY